MGRILGVRARILSIFILGLLLFGAPLYAVRPLSIEETTSAIEGEIPAEIERAIEAIKKEKIEIMKAVSPLREERRKNLRPFVYDEIPSGSEVPPVRRIVKGFIPDVPKTEVAGPESSDRSVASKLLPNLIFFSVIAIALLAAYYLIRPRSNK